MPDQYYYIQAKDSVGDQVWQAIIQEDYDEVLGFDRNTTEARWAIADLKQRGFTVTRRKFSTVVLDEALKDVPSQAE